MKMKGYLKATNEIKGGSEILKKYINYIREGSGGNGYFLPHSNQPALICVKLLNESDIPWTRTYPSAHLMLFPNLSGLGRQQYFVHP